MRHQNLMAPYLNSIVLQFVRPREMREILLVICGFTRKFSCSIITRKRIISYTRYVDDTLVVFDGTYVGKSKELVHIRLY